MEKIVMADLLLETEIDAWSVPVPAVYLLAMKTLIIVWKTF